jgi:predicted transcriptional regulator
MIRRERTDIIFDILENIQKSQGKIKPTHLMYKSNLSHEKLKKYTEELIKRGFITKDLEGKKYLFFMTDKGYTYLSEIKKIKEFSDSFGL